MCVCGAGVLRWNDLAGGIGGRQLGFLSTTAAAVAAAGRLDRPQCG